MFCSQAYIQLAGNSYDRIVAIEGKDLISELILTIYHTGQGVDVRRRCFTENHYSVSFLVIDYKRLAAVERLECGKSGHSSLPLTVYH